jgi:4-amino-4-deoxy-L-arabinose transferase-like glycosyltransferase
MTDDFVSISRARVDRAIRRVRDAAFGPPGAVALVALATVLYRLGERPLWWWDESFYAVAARLALDRGHWVVPHTAGFDRLAPYPFLEKPPLAIWLEAVSVGLLGPTEFAVRLPSALAAVGCVLLAYAVARRTDGRVAGVAAAAVLLTTPMLVVGTNGARFGAYDTLHVLLGSGLVAVVWLRATDRRAVGALPTGLVCGALLLTKGFAAGAFLLAAAPVVLLRRERFGVGYVAVAGGVAAALAGGWVVAAYLAEGPALVGELFVEQVWGRITGEMSVTTHETVVPGLRYPYATIAQEWAWPWWFLFLAGAVVTARRWVRERSDDDLLLLWWTVATALPFALAGTVPWYVLPATVPAAVVVGRVVADAARGDRPALAAVGTGTLLVVLAGPDRRLYEPTAEGWVALAPGPDFALAGVAGVLALVAGAALLTGRFGLSALARDPFPVDGARVVRLAVVALVVGAVVATLVGAPSAYDVPADTETTREIDTAMRAFGEQSGAAVPAGEPVYVQPNAEARWFYSSFVFYADRGVRPVSVERLRTDPSVEYAVVTGSGVSLASDREPAVLVRSERLELVLVRLGPPPEERPGARAVRTR